VTVETEQIAFLQFFENKVPGSIHHPGYVKKLPVSFSVVERQGFHVFRVSTFDALPAQQFHAFQFSCFPVFRPLLRDGSSATLPARAQI
jgi:hypothetical protein